MLECRTVLAVFRSHTCIDRHAGVVSTNTTFDRWHSLLACRRYSYEVVDGCPLLPLLCPARSILIFHSTSAAGLLQPSPSCLAISGSGAP